MEMNKRIKNNQQEKLNITSGSRDISRMPVGISKYEMSEIDKLSFNQGFQKGKLEVLNRIDKLQKKRLEYNSLSVNQFVEELKEQLQKEIGGMK